jgi:copper chaperone CopZ
MLRLSVFVAGLALIILGCQQRESEQAADMTPESVTAVAFNVDGAPTVAFDVPDMMCPESCAVKTRQILSEQPGVQDVIVDFDTKTATVAIAEGEFDADAAIAALVDHGFDHSKQKSAN